MGFIEGKIKQAVGIGMLELEEKLLLVEREALEKNRKLMLERLDDMEKLLKECVHTEVLKQLKGRV